MVRERRAVRSGDRSGAPGPEIREVSARTAAAGLAITVAPAIPACTQWALSASQRTSGIARSEDDGRSFSRPVQVNDDPPGTVSPFPLPWEWIRRAASACAGWTSAIRRPRARDLTRVYFARQPTARALSAGTSMRPPGSPIRSVTAAEWRSRTIQGAYQSLFGTTSTIGATCFSCSPQTTDAPSAPRRLWSIRGGRSPLALWMVRPSAWIPSGNLHAVWMSGAKMTATPVFGGGSGESKILYNRVAPGFAKAQEPILLGEGHHPRLAIGPSGEAVILWHRDTSILLARLGPGAHEVPRHIQIGDEQGVSSYPSLALRTDGAVWCVWQESQPDNSIQIKLSCVPQSSFSSKQ